jgi:hypothetical protein
VFWSLSDSRDSLSSIALIIFHLLIESCNERAPANKVVFQCLGNEIAGNYDQSSEKFRKVSGIPLVAGNVRVANEQ